VTHPLAADPDALSAPGGLLADRYRIIELLGTGGMARVYRAHDERLGREVAIKQLRADVADPDALRRQREEIRAIAAIHHPAVVTLYDAFPDESDRVVLVMQCVPGQDLRQVLQRGPLDQRRVVAIGLALADALASVHAAGIIHRDIKPGNILVLDPEATGPAAMLGDFGIARIADGTGATATGTIIGTAAYLSPEQASGDPITPATDLYSLGLVLIEALTGTQPFPGSHAETAIARLSRDAEIPEDIDPALRRLLRALTERDPSMRPTAAEAAARFAAILSGAADAEEATAPTRVLHPPTAATERIGEAPPAPSAPSAAGARPTAGIAPPIPRARRSQVGLVVALVLVALALAAVVAWIIWMNASGGPAPLAPAPSYPAVSGPLGDDLRQLQEAIEP